ncbi:MAG: PAS domain S-box protein [Methylobacter sp.]
MSADSIACPNMLIEWLKQLGIALLYLLFGYVINHHFTNNNIVCTVWPGAGLALGVLLIGGRRYIRGLILGSLALNTLSNDSLWAIGGITLTHTVEALLGVWLLTRNGRSVLSLHTLRDYRRLVISGGVAGIAGAMIGGLSILLAGYITPADYLANVLRWWMGDTLGVVLVTPLMLAWWQEKCETFKARQQLEALLLSGLSFLVGQIVFLGWFREYLTEAPKGYWLFLCVTWVALRLGNRGVTFVLLMIAVQALTGAYYQIGFFAAEIAIANLYNYWAYMSILSVVGMTLAAYVSELKRTLTALQVNSARIQLLLDSSLDGVVSMDHNGNVIGWNAQAEHIFGYSGEQALGRDTAELIVPPAYRERHRQGLSRFIEIGASDIIGTRLEVTGLHADASEFPIEMAVHALKQQDSYFFSAYIRDISKRKQAEAAQQEVLDKLHKIARQLPGVVFQFRLRKDGSSCLPYVSEVLRDIYRVDPEDVVDDASKIFAVVHPDDLDGHLASIQASARDLKPWRNEYRLRFADGTERWLFGNALPQREEDGSVLWHGFVTDITERKQMEEKLRDSDAFNASILNSLTSHITVLDAQGGIIAVNDAWRRFAKENGLPESSRDMLGFNYLDACKNSFNQAYGDEASIAQSGITEVLAGDREIFHLEYPCHSPTEQRWFQMNVSPLQGSRPGVVISHKNITERKKAEEIAQAASQYARSLIEASLDPLVTISAEGKVTDVNTATEQVTGVNRDSLIGSDFADYFIDPEKAREGYLRVFSQGFVTDYPLAIRHVSGKVTEVLYNASLYRDGNGNVLGVFAAARDITERKQIEAELIRSNADLEQFAYAVSHDMRQPLRMVSSYLSLIENALAGQLNEETQQFLDFARDGAKRMDAMILSLLDYSRIGRKFEAKTWISSKTSLDEALAFLKPELNTCGGEIKVTGDWPELFASRDELTRLFQNLVGNALKYHEEDQPPQVDIHGTIHARSLRVEVRDHGIGIEPSQVNRLFKVFSRLQARSRFEGTGVGLALCRKIVEHHEGGIGVESAGEGQGCLFWFELPLVNAVNPE